MGIDELRKLLRETEDKLSIFTDAEKLSEYDINSDELQSLLREFLSDAEKEKLLDYPIYEGNIEMIIASISDQSKKMQLLGKQNLNNTQVLYVIKSFSDEIKKGLLSKLKDSLDIHSLFEIASSLSEDAKEEMLEDLEYLRDELQFGSYEITELIKSLSVEETRIRVIKKVSLVPYYKMDLIRTLSDKNKLGVILEDEDLSSTDRIILFGELELEALNELFTDYMKNLESQGIKPFQVVMDIAPEKQLEFIDRIEEMGFTENEKLEIFATLKPETNEKVDTANLKEQYKRAISVETSEYDGRAKIDFDRDLTVYKGLDRLIREYPEECTEEERKKLKILGDICPDMKIYNKLAFLYSSSPAEYKEAEEWIDTVMEKLKPEYSDAQKLAVIDNEIGKKISYSPDFGTEVSNTADARSLWRIIASGYGICNGIASVEKYILSRVRN